VSTALAGTVGEALGAAADALAAAGVGTPRLDAELLLAAAMGADRAQLAADPAGGVDAQAARRFGEMVRRRLAREPVAYILGRKGFRHLELAVDRRVLIPRPETELLVELALELRPRSVLDVGTGSGAVALAIAHELGEDASVRGVDTSAGAIAVARANAARLSFDVDFRRVGAQGRHSDTESPVNGPWDLVLANLPYVSDDQWPTLSPEIREYEPREALLGGPDGLGPITALLGDLPSCRAVGLEVGAGQAGAVSELVRRAGFDRVDARRDLAGIDRLVVGRR
jgi:release factor glutamine methyltransferase